MHNYNAVTPLSINLYRLLSSLLPFTPNWVKFKVTVAEIHSNATTNLNFTFLDGLR